MNRTTVWLLAALFGGLFAAVAQESGERLNLSLPTDNDALFRGGGAEFYQYIIRDYKGVISVKNGEPAVVTGMISRSESRSLQGLPGISSLPLLSHLGSTVNNNENDDEILVILTPHITIARETSSQVILMPRPGQ